MIQVTPGTMEAIISHALRELPNEACGYLAGSGGVISQSYQLTNMDHSPEHFTFDPAEQFAAVKKARKEGLEILANYHSHPQTPARPSLEDIRLAYDPAILYFIVSTAEKEAVIKAYKIVNGTVERIEISLV
jgi:[CysO sulfur-carrier protein]-S-L-cysteine hydrolase